MPNEYTSDGAGGYVTSLDLVRISECRFSKMVVKGETGDSSTKWGYSGEFAFRVVLPPTLAIENSWFLSTVDQLGVKDGRYRILHIKQQFDFAGTHHHTSIICELEDV